MYKKSKFSSLALAALAILYIYALVAGETLILRSCLHILVAPGSLCVCTHISLSRACSSETISMLFTIKKVDQFKTILVWHFDCVNTKRIAEMCEVYTCLYAKICLHIAHIYAQT